MYIRLSSTRIILGVSIVLLACLSLAVVGRWERSIADLSSADVSNNEMHTQTESKPDSSSETKLALADEPTKARVIESYGKLPLSFEANNGQIDSSDVRFISRGDGYNLYLSPTSARLVLSRPVANTDKGNLSTKEKTHSDRDLLKKPELLKPDNKADPQPTEQSVIGMKLVGANTESVAKGTDVLEGKSNYFIGNDSSKWRTDVANYKKARFEEVYSGIDIEYYGNQRQLEYDFIVAPNADPNQIKLEFDGVENISVNKEGELVLQTEGAKEEIRQKKPFVYQLTEAGEKQQIVGNYRITEEGEVGFELGEYDGSKDLVIDPIVLVYSTYLGGGGDDSASDIALDAQGNVYIIRRSSSASLNVFSSAHVTKINATGNSIVYSTYLGDGILGTSIAVDAQGNAYITGLTGSNFPLVNAQQSNHGGGSDAFVTKINSTGNSLIYSTYLGGYFPDTGEAIAVDSAGNAYVTGFTNSFDFPVYKAIQSRPGGPPDAFVTKYNPTGSIIYSTFLGGTGDDRGYEIAADSAGNAYVTGFTRSTDFPLANAQQTTLGADPFAVERVDAFVTKISPTGNSLIYSTYLGGAGNEYGGGIAADSAGNTYVTGQTDSVSFPVSNALQSRIGGGVSDAFITKYDATGSTYIYSTYLGGSNSDYGYDIAADRDGNAYVTGLTNSANFPVVNAFQSLSQGSDAFITKLNAAGSAFAFSTYFGGSSNDTSLGIALDNTGNIYLAGITLSIDLPIANASQPVLSGRTDAFISKILILTNSVSGRVTTVAGQALVGVQLNPNGDTQNKTLSNNNGDYKIELLRGNNHTFAPSFSTHRFSPPAYSFTPLTANQSNVNFTATLINNNFVDAVTLTGTSGEVIGNNADATKQSGEPLHAGQPGGHSVWYRWRAPASGSAAFSTYGSSFDTTLAVYTGTALGNLTLIANGANDDANAPIDITSRVEFSATANTEYWIAVDGKQTSNSGNFKLNYYSRPITITGVVTRSGIQQAGLTVQAISTDDTVTAYATTASLTGYSMTLPSGTYTFKVFQGSIQQGLSTTTTILGNGTLNIELVNPIARDCPPGISCNIGRGLIILPVGGSTNGLTALAQTGSSSAPCQFSENNTQYTCPGLLPGGNYTIVLTSPNFEFFPSEHILNNLQGNHISLNFEATHRISGKVVIEATGVGVNNVLITVTGNTPQRLLIQTRTNASGEYEVKVPTGYNYTVAPSLTGLAFSAISSYTALKNHERADFRVLGNCSYTVTPEIGITIPASGAEAQPLSITTSSACSSTAVSNDPWITIGQTASTGIGSRAVSYSVIANPATVSRTGTITIAGITITVTQSAAAINQLSGVVRYGTTPLGQALKFVPGVTFTASGSPLVSATTLSNGIYSLADLGSGPYMVTASKPNQTDNNGISPQDASEAAKIAFGINANPTANQRLAADATGNGTVSLQDASEIAKRAFNNPSNVTNIVGQWKFIGSPRPYANLTGSLSAENYEAILVGDVTGNWMPPSTGTAAPESEETNKEQIGKLFEVNQLIKDQNILVPDNNYLLKEHSSRLIESGQPTSDAQSIIGNLTDIEVSLPLASDSAGRTVLIPVMVGDLTGKEVESYDFTVSFDPAVLQPAPIAFDWTGTLTEAAGNYQVMVDTMQESGKLRIGAFGITPLEGAGTIIYLRFNVVGEAAEEEVNSSLKFEQFIFGETALTELIPESGNWYQTKSSQRFGEVRLGATNDKLIPNSFAP